MTDSVGQACEGCKKGWPLGRFGCHYEPLPDGLDWEDFTPLQMNCTNWAERRKEFYGDQSG